ncbi:MAG: tRNA-intron lyase [Thermoplasmatota archaeon]
MTGQLQEENVIVSDEKKGNQLYNKGYFGKPMSGGGVELDLYEALYLYEAERLDVANPPDQIMDRDGLWQHSLKFEDEFSLKYPIYRDMRRRGYVVKTASKPADFRVFPRGGGPGKTQSKYWLCGRAETDEFSINEVVSICDRVSDLKKTLLFGLLDEEGDVTYYNISTIDLKGSNKKIEGKYQATLTKNKCIVDESGRALREEGFYGKERGDVLQLSLVETLYLLSQGRLRIFDGQTGEELGEDDFREHGKKVQRDFELRENIYEDLRDNGLIPKTGFKYGTAFRAYKKNPEQHHAECLIHPIEHDFRTSWYEVSRFVRLAHSVRKEFIFGKDTESADEEPSYIKVKRETP